MIHEHIYHTGDKVIHRFPASAPTTRTDGTPLDIADIAGYKATRVVSSYIEDSEPAAFEYVDSAPVDIPGLAIVDLGNGKTGFNYEIDIAEETTPVAYEFSFQTIDMQGQYSAPSDVVRVVILPLAAPNPPEVS
jgi:hypothetical protein